MTAGVWSGGKLFPRVQLRGAMSMFSREWQGGLAGPSPSEGIGTEGVVPEFPSWKWILLPFPRTSIPKVSCVKLTKHFLNTALVNSTQPQSVSR